MADGTRAFLPLTDQLVRTPLANTMRWLLMPGAGLEPARLAAQASKTCVAANYTTPAGLHETSRPHREHEALPELPG
jgi:hypothetical protein